MTTPEQREAMRMRSHEAEDKADAGTQGVLRIGPRENEPIVGAAYPLEADYDDSTGTHAAFTSWADARFYAFARADVRALACFVQTLTAEADTRDAEIAQLREFAEKVKKHSQHTYSPRDIGGELVYYCDDFCARCGAVVTLTGGPEKASDQ